MAVPTFLSITPNTGLTLGQELVTILGSNFKAPTPQSADPVTGITPEAPPSVMVTFDGVPALRVDWITQGHLVVLTPAVKEKTSADGKTVVPVDVVITNIDDNGDPIAGETVTASGVFTYKYTNLYQNDTSLVRITRAVIQDWKKQVHPNIVLTVHTDFDSKTQDYLNVTNIAKLPAIVLQGPSTQENRFYSVNEDEIFLPLIDGDPFIVRRPQRIQDLIYQVLILSNSTVELYNLVELATSYLHYNRNMKFTLATGEEITLEMDQLESFVWDSSPNMSNIRRATGSFIIKGHCTMGPYVGIGTQVEEPIINVNPETGEQPELIICAIDENS